MTLTHDMHTCEAADAGEKKPFHIVNHAICIAEFNQNFQFFDILIVCH